MPTHTYVCSNSRCGVVHLVAEPAERCVYCKSVLIAKPTTIVTGVFGAGTPIAWIDPKLHALEAAKDGAYAERNRCVATMARMAMLLGWRAGLARHPESDEAWDRDWMTIVFIDFPTGQASWHVHDSEVDLFDWLPPYAGAWDGHTTDEKYRHMMRFARG